MSSLIMAPVSEANEAEIERPDYWALMKRRALIVPTASVVLLTSLAFLITNVFGGSSPDESRASAVEIDMATYGVVARSGRGEPPRRPAGYADGFNLMDLDSRELEKLPPMVLRAERSYQSEKLDQELSRLESLRPGVERGRAYPWGLPEPKRQRSRSVGAVVESFDGLIRSVEDFVGFSSEAGKH